MSFADSDLTPVVDDVLIASESTGLGNKSNTRAARDIGIRLIITEAAKHAIGGGDVVVETNVKLGFVKAAGGLARKIEGTAGSATGVGVGGWVEVNQSLPDRVRQTVGASRDFVTGRSGCLASVGVGGQRVARAIALEVGISGPEHIWIGDDQTGDGYTEVVCAEIAIAHGEGGNESCKRIAHPLVRLLSIEKKESLIFLDGAADRSAKLIQIELLRGVLKGNLGIRSVLRRNSNSDPW